MDLKERIKDIEKLHKEAVEKVKQEVKKSDWIFLDEYLKDIKKYEYLLYHLKEVDKDFDFAVVELKKIGLRRGSKLMRGKTHSDLVYVLRSEDFEEVFE